LHSPSTKLPSRPESALRRSGSTTRCQPMPALGVRAVGTGGSQGSNRRNQPSCRSGGPTHHSRPRFDVAGGSRRPERLEAWPARTAAFPLSAEVATGAGESTQSRYRLRMAAAELAGAYPTEAILAVWLRDGLSWEPTKLAACDNCGRCAAFCVTGALRRTRVNGESNLAVVPSACTGCDACVDFCPQQAIAVVPAPAVLMRESACAI